MATGRSTKVKAAQSTAAGPARTVVYIHGIGNKPEEEVLRCQWDRALFEYRLGERSRMAYWCQVDRHGPPVAATCAEPDSLLSEARGAQGLRARALRDGESPIDAAREVGQNRAEQESLERLIGQMGLAGGHDRKSRRGRKLSAQGVEDVDFPDFLVRWLTGAFLEDVRDFFFDTRRRTRMQDSLRRCLATGGPFVVVAHSQGSMIAYSLLQQLDAAKFQVPLFLTIGSPLGLAEVRDHLREINNLGNRKKLPTPACVGRWVNVFDPRDKVSRRERLSEHYSGSCTPVDFEFPNADRDEPHSGTGYLQIARVRSEVRKAIDLQRFQPLAPFRLAADVVHDFERAGRAKRRPILIELSDPTWVQRRCAELTEAQHQPPRWAVGETVSRTDSPGAMADAVAELIGEVVGKLDPLDRRMQRLGRYLSVDLTREEVERLAACYPDLAPFYRIWRNGKKVARIDTSIHTVQASAAHRSYEAYGQGIEWAVLDSGCSTHPHFSSGGHRTIEARWDCTLVSDQPVQDGTRIGSQIANSQDGYGHGTHVAGIIAGRCELQPKGGGSPRILSGMAPQARLHIYKVLDDDGEGEDAWIIKALDHIAQVNERAGGPRIAGINLSLGGPFDQDVFGCGHTPLCDELRRLWRQGVVVVIAAGNEGFTKLLSSDGEIPANMPMSLGDPANLEQAIAVGSVHKERPHTYGVSHFSSRGPTADGRMKPDCVAPGEQILSCRHDVAVATRASRVGELYMKLDGTSMAAPHVSGILAAFLSRRREFIGDPDRVKQILLTNCTSLDRDRAMQGAGMPNLVRMLVST